MHYQGKHYQKRFVPIARRYQKRVVKCKLYIKQKVHILLTPLANLIDKHDAWWDAVDLRLGAFIDKQFMEFLRIKFIIMQWFSEFK